MILDLSEKSDLQIANLIANHEAKKAFDRPLYKAALEERAKRSPFDFERSCSLIEAAAREGRFVSYGELAAASEVPWSKAYFLLGTHLWELVSWAKLKGLPMLSAIVVNKEGVASGDMAEGTRDGFVRAAEHLGYAVNDPEVFLKEQQRAVFAHYGASRR